MINGLGERLQEQRNILNLSQKEVASMIGVSASVISNYESGERTPSLEILMALAALFHCSSDYLLGLNSINTLPLDISMLSNEQTVLLQHFLYSLH